AMETISAVLSTIGAHGATLATGTGFFVVGLAGCLGALTYVLVRLPEDYLVSPQKPAASKVGKNVLGVVLIGGGVVMSIPGCPGPGVLPALVGVTLLDIPGARRLEQRLLGEPRVLAAVNRLRGRFGKPPLQASYRAS